MRKLNCLLFAFFALTQIQAQAPADLLKDPEVIWLAETYILFNPDMNRAELKKNGISGHSYTLKTISTLEGGKDLYDEEAHRLSEKFFRKGFLYSEKQYVYHDSLLTKQMGDAERRKIGSSIDTVITFDPETFQEIINVVVQAVDYEAIKYYKMRVWVYYHRKDMTYKVWPLAIAPVDERGKSLFWIPMEKTDKTDLANPSFDWVKRISFTCPISGPNVKVLKDPKKDCFFDIFMSDLKKEAPKTYNTMVLLGNEELSKKEIQAIGNETDTIITFDPKTFKENRTVVKNELKAGAVKEVRIVQDWIWDYKKQQLLFRPLGFAPIIDRYDDAARFLNSGPMFYRREKGVE